MEPKDNEQAKAIREAYADAAAICEVQASASAQTLIANALRAVAALIRNKAERRKLDRRDTAKHWKSMERNVNGRLKERRRNFKKSEAKRRAIQKPES